MDGIQNNDVATLSLLGGGAFGGAGYHSLQNTANFAHDGSVLNAKAENNNDTIRAGHLNLSQQINDAADRARDAAATSIATSNYERTNDKISDQSKAFATSFNELIREGAANAREAAKCCCEAQLLAVQNQAKTDAGLATIIANQECNDKVANAVANATQNAKLDSLLSERGHGPGWTNHGTGRAPARDKQSSGNITIEEIQLMIDTTLRTVLTDLMDININIPNELEPSEVIDAETDPVVSVPALNKKQGGFLNIFGKKGE